MNSCCTVDNVRGGMDAPEPARTGPTYSPVVDIVELPDAYVLRADVPGTTAGQLEVDYERGQLTIAARVTPRQSPSTRYVLREFGVGDFVRSFQIGEGIDAGKIEATVNLGVLTLHMPKTAAAKARKIEVKAAG